MTLWPMPPIEAPRRVGGSHVVASIKVVARPNEPAHQWFVITNMAATSFTVWRVHWSGNNFVSDAANEFSDYARRCIACSRGPCRNYRHQSSRNPSHRIPR